MIHSPPKATVVDRAITAIRVNVNFVMVNFLLLRVKNVKQVA